MSVEDELDRQRTINVKLRKQLERVRIETVEYCAKFCEDHEVGFVSGLCMPRKGGGDHAHPGDGYARGLRGIIGGPLSGK